MNHEQIAYDCETNSFGSCKTAACARCTRYQLDLCPGNFEDEEEDMNLEEEEDLEDEF